MNIWENFGKPAIAFTLLSAATYGITRLSLRSGDSAETALFKAAICQLGLGLMATASYGIFRVCQSARAEGTGLWRSGPTITLSPEKEGDIAQDPPSAHDYLLANS